ncbi:methyltransferase [Phenylobacterium sp.]|uniref:class I SAM-dependent methyltransferase n=1 Tax=Phenylobacterium sp. TaxID=1871053 RepID=UPI0025D1997C|nr:methyltransferase [Phenylobacterium sp.]
MKRLFLAAALMGIALTAQAATPAPIAQAPIAQALADPSRAEDVARDGLRHAAELLSFMEVRPGQKVADLIPGGGYFTRLLSKVVGPKGKVYAVFPKEYLSEGDGEVKKLQAQAADPKWANIIVIVEPAAAFAAPERLDMVWTSQNYHDYPDKFMGPTDPKLLNAAVYKALKPGGLFVIVDHAAQVGSGLRDTETLHRIDEATVKAQVLAAGFEFVGESPVLRNPEDARTLLVFDKAIRGKTDQFAFKFRKPKTAR